MKRPTIGDAEFDAARLAVPAPKGFSWQFDPAASSDRLRLFREPSGGEVGGAYPNGQWWVDDVEKSYRAAAEGKEASLLNAMSRVLLIAKALGHSGL